MTVIRARRHQILLAADADVIGLPAVGIQRIGGFLAELLVVALAIDNSLADPLKQLLESGCFGPEERCA